MADKVIDIPGVGVVAFPDTMSDADISTQAAKLYEGGSKPAPAAPTLGAMLANVPTDEAGKPLGEPSPLRQSLESMAFPKTAGDVASLTIPGGADVAAAIRSGIRSAPTLAGAALGYAAGGVHGAIEGATGVGLIGMSGRMIRGAIDAARDLPKGSPASQVLQAIKEQGTTIQAQHFNQAVNRVARGEDAMGVVKEFSKRAPATTAEAREALGIPKPEKPADVIPFSSALREALPPFPEAPRPNVAAPLEAVQPPAEAAVLPKSWKPYAGQTELGPVLPAQPPGKTMAGNPQQSRPFVPPASKPPMSPAGKVNTVMNETGLRFPTRFLDAAIKRVKNGEDPLLVVREYAGAQ